MHVIERVLDRFQEWCSGCVAESIGSIVGQIKWDLTSFSGVQNISSDFTGLGLQILEAGVEAEIRTLVYHPSVHGKSQVVSFNRPTSGASCMKHKFIS